MTTSGFQKRSAMGIGIVPLLDSEIGIHCR
jgi:hypothetical protein